MKWSRRQWALVGALAFGIATPAGAQVSEARIRELIKQAAGIEKGSGVPNRDKVASLTHAQVIDIAQKKMADLNANDVEMAARIIAGTARSMGVEVEA